MHQSPPNESPFPSLLRLATAPVNWNNNDIPGWRPVVPFPKILDRVREAGYDAVEFDGSFGSDPDQLNAEAIGRDLTWSGCYQWLDLLDRDGIERVALDLAPRFQLLQEIGCEHLIIADSLRPDRVALAGRVPADASRSLSDSDVARIADSAHLVADIAEGFGLSVHYHNHVGSWIEAPHEVLALLDHLDPDRVDLCFDTGHYAYGGGDAASFLREHLDAVGYLHLKDVDADIVTSARERQLSFIDALKEYVFSPLGKGTADIPSILETLIESGFDGWVVVEQDTCEGDSTATARENLEFIQHWMDRNQSITENGRTPT